MDKKEYMSGDELYRYLHISKRKMRYLLQNGYIPVIDTGKKTHRYMVKVDDAAAFHQQMLETPDFIFELKGRFNSRKPVAPLLEPTPENCKAFAEYLTELWADLPDALSTKTAASLVGYSFQRVQECVREGLIFGMTIGNVRYCTKDSFIEYVASAERVAVPRRTEKYYTLIRDFVKIK